MNDALRMVLAVASSMEGLESGPDMKLRYLGEILAEIDAEGDSVIIDVRCNPLDSGPLVEEYPCCAPDRGRQEDGWVTFIFSAPPGPDELSAVAEALYSGMDRIMPDAGGADIQEEE